MEGVLDKIKEEIEEIKTAETDFELASEIGDLFFAIVNLARWKKADAESALRGTNMKFKKRFAYVEQGAKKKGRNLSDLKDLPPHVRAFADHLAAAVAASILREIRAGRWGTLSGKHEEGRGDAKDDDGK